MTTTAPDPVHAVLPADPDDPELRALDRLVGVWALSGEATGTVTYDWMDGGRFLVQHGYVELMGHRNTFTEIVGREKVFGGQPSADIRARTYTADGDTLDYVYELVGDELVIWGGERGSVSYFRGRFSADDTVLEGSWVWPGGGYQVTSTRCG